MFRPRAKDWVADRNDDGPTNPLVEDHFAVVAVRSHYAAAGSLVKFIRVGTLDAPDLLPPSIHIFTASKQPWVVPPEAMPAVADYFDHQQYWPSESLARLKVLLPLIEAYRVGKGSGSPSI
jgi:hypothetical protein